jgi:hypothetical protein
MMKFIEDTALILVIGGFILGLALGYYATHYFEGQGCSHSHATLSSHSLHSGYASARLSQREL